MQVTCGCGKVLNVPETLMGKTARCPACKKVFQMPGGAPAAAVAARIAMSCACGRKLAAPAAAAGKKVRCPKCNNELTVPGPQQSASGQAGPGAAKGPSAPVIVPMPPPASYEAAPAAPRKPAPEPTEELMFDIEAPPLEPPKPKPLPVELPGGQAQKADGQAEKDEYGIGAPKCPNCKAELPRGAQFCVECGTALATGTKIKSVALPDPKAKKKAKINMDAEMVKKIIYGAIMVVALGFAYWRLCKPSGLTPEQMKEAARKAAAAGTPGVPGTPGPTGARRPAGAGRLPGPDSE